MEAFARFETVDVLFLMSAYLLTLSYARAALDGTSLLPAREFLFRRAVRIVPLYWIAVTTVWALRNPALPGDWRDLVEHLLFVQVFDRERIFYTLGPDVVDEPRGHVLPLARRARRPRRCGPAAASTRAAAGWRCCWPAR